MRKLKAFTLAEVLVTLMIIGVIAAMTIPSLNQNIQYNHFVAGCLKSYSVLSQAIERMKLDFGPVGFGAKWNNEQEFWKAFVAQMNAVEVCDKTENGCWYNEEVKTSGGRDDGNYYRASKGEYRLVTADGMLYTLAFSRYPGLIGTCFPDEDKDLYMGRIAVDVNGFKGPNRTGLEIFTFILLKGKGIMPCGYTMTENTSTLEFYKDQDVTRTAYIIANKKFPPTKK